MDRRAFPILTVTDLSSARSFYERLGFEQRYQFPPEGEPGYVTMGRGADTLGLTADESGDAFSYWVYVDDVDAVVEALRAAGVTVVTEPADQPWGERVAQVRDPAGNLVHLGAAPSGPAS